MIFFAIIYSFLILSIIFLIFTNLVLSENLKFSLFTLEIKVSSSFIEGSFKAFFAPLIVNPLFLSKT